MASTSSDRRRCLDELDPPAWGKPTFNSYLVTTCHRLRKKPIGEFSTEDLRIMIGQSISLEFLVPLGLEAVEREALAEGDYYPGDLLSSLLMLEPAFWVAHPEWRGRLATVVAVLESPPEELVAALRRFHEIAV